MKHTTLAATVLLVSSLATYSLDRYRPDSPAQRPPQSAQALSSSKESPLEAENSSNNKTLPPHELTLAEEREQKLIAQLGTSVFFGALFVVAYVSACAIGS